MNWGAKVPTGVLFRFELERRRAESLRPSMEPLRLVRLVRERLRRWPMAGSASARGEEKRADLGRLAVSVPGGGVDVFLAKGLLRELRAKGRPLGAGALMVVVGVLIVMAGATDYLPDIVWGEGRKGRQTEAAWRARMLGWTGSLESEYTAESMYKNARPAWAKGEPRRKLVVTSSTTCTTAACVPPVVNNDKRLSLATKPLRVRHCATVPQKSPPQPARAWR